MRLIKRVEDSIMLSIIVKFYCVDHVTLTMNRGRGWQVWKKCKGKLWETWKWGEKIIGYLSIPGTQGLSTPIRVVHLCFLWKVYFNFEETEVTCSKLEVMQIIVVYRKSHCVQWSATDYWLPCQIGQFYRHFSVSCLTIYMCGPYSL